jgi:hypothetical protein
MMIPIGVEHVIRAGRCTAYVVLTRDAVSFWREEDEGTDGHRFEQVGSIHGRVDKLLKENTPYQLAVAALKVFVNISRSNDDVAFARLIAECLLTSMGSEWRNVRV